MKLLQTNNKRTLLNLVSRSSVLSKRVKNHHNHLRRMLCDDIVMCKYSRKSCQYFIT